MSQALTFSPQTRGNRLQFYRELARQLTPHVEAPMGSVEFVAEGTVAQPLVVLCYPGRKQAHTPPPALVPWTNATDFLVVPYQNNTPLAINGFTFAAIAQDFYDHKLHSDHFWQLIEQLYTTDEWQGQPPHLAGIDPTVFLYALKWIWVQEDLNYKYSWDDIQSPLRYKLATAKGGAGRAKSLGLFVLLRYGYDLKTALKTISPRT